MGVEGSSGLRFDVGAVLRGTCITAWGLGAGRAQVCSPDVGETGERRALRRAPDSGTPAWLKETQRKGRFQLGPQGLRGNQGRLPGGEPCSTPKAFLLSSESWQLYPWSTLNYPECSLGKGRRPITRSSETSLMRQARRMPATPPPPHLLVSCQPELHLKS